MRIDLHMHSTASDGTLTPQSLVSNIIDAGLSVFALTDHDEIKGCLEVIDALSKRKDPPKFITGIEFSCKDDVGKYHLLGYGYDPGSEAIQAVVKKAVGLRLQKMELRLQRLSEEHGIELTAEERDELFAHNNPGRPHIANILIRRGVVKDRDEAFRDYIGGKIPSEHITPKEAIDAITEAGGVPVLAHPFMENGTSWIGYEELKRRVDHLVSLGLKGLECYYQRFGEDQSKKLLGLASEYDLYVTAGSDFHGENKPVILGDIGPLGNRGDLDIRVSAFLDAVSYS